MLQSLLAVRSYVIYIFVVHSQGESNVSEEPVSWKYYIHILAIAPTYPAIIKEPPMGVTGPRNFKLKVAKVGTCSSTHNFDNTCLHPAQGP